MRRCVNLLLVDGKKETNRACNGFVMAEMEEDRERAELLKEISELLLSGGYFRAQISTLSPFDMLTGGLAWSITASNVDVDFDVLYDDDATLGHKIKVGEAIEEALQRMECPYPLQAHQIQGLDYPAVLSVVQWLVKRVLATREESGDQLRKYALWKYQQLYEVPDEAAAEHIRLERIKAASQSSTRLSDDGLYPQAKDRLSKLQISDADALDHNSQVGEPTFSLEQQTASLEKQINLQKARIELLQMQRDSERDAAQAVDLAVKKQEGRREEMAAEREELQLAADAAGAGLVVQDMVTLLQQSLNFEHVEAEFRVSCRRKRAELIARIKHLQDPAQSLAKDEERQAEVEATYEADLHKLRSVRKELAQKCREVALLQRQLDDVPTQSELIQYERRFMELYLHIQRKLRETRKYFATYNALAEAHELTVKETSLLNSIHFQFEAAMMTTGGRAKFVESLEGIVKGVKQKLQKMEKRLQAEKDTYSTLKEKHVSCVAAQRNYFSLLKLFQEECALSEKMRAALEPFAGITLKDAPLSPLVLPLELEPRQQSFVSPL